MSCKVCTTGAKNTGTVTTTAQGKPLGLLYQATIANDGTRNKLSGAAPVSQAELVALINHVDPSKRIYPSGFLRAIVDDPADAVFESFDDDSRAKLRNGIRTFTGMRVGQDTKHLRKLENMICAFGGNLSAYRVDECKNIIGKDQGDGDLYPVPIDTLSADFKVMPQSNARTVALAHSFDWARYEKDSDLDMFRVGVELEDGVDASQLNGLVDVFGLYPSAGAADTVDVFLTADYGGIKGEPIVGIAADKFEFTRDADDTTFAPTDVSYDETGLATFTFPASETGGTLTLSMSVDGYDSSQLETVQVVIA
jgi:hypothetical protein